MGMEEDTFDHRLKMLFESNPPDLLKRSFNNIEQGHKEEMNALCPDWRYAALISAYTGHLSVSVNSESRVVSRDPPIFDFLYRSLLEEALRSLQPMNNVQVWRVMKVALETKKKILSYLNMRKGCYIRFPQFLSTMKKRPSIEDLSYDADDMMNHVFFEIKTSRESSLRDIEPIVAVTFPSRAQSETEALFIRNTFFKILDVQAVTVRLEEIPRSEVFLEGTHDFWEDQ